MDDMNYYDDEGEVIEPYDEDEYQVPEDELCDCGSCHFLECYGRGCFGKPSRWLNDDDDELEDDFWDDEDFIASQTVNIDTDESEGIDERSIGTPPSDLSDIPF